MANMREIFKGCFSMWELLVWGGNVTVVYGLFLAWESLIWGKYVRVVFDVEADNAGEMC